MTCFFLILGGFPKAENIIVNGQEVDISDWVRKFKTASHYIEKEARLCEVSADTINAKILNRMSSIHMQTLSSVEYIVCDYYSHVVSNHRIELMTNTIEGFLGHTGFYNQLLKELKQKNNKKRKVDYIESVERIFKLFFYYHRKYNCQILNHMHVKNKQEFYEIISDTRNDFSHLLEDKKYRLILGKEMVYFIDLIFLAERLFLLAEVLGIPLLDFQIKEYMYILHDWIDEMVNGRTDRIQSARYKKVVNAKEINKFLAELQENYN